MSTTSNNNTIYQEIWTADQNENGVPAILPSDKTTPRDKGYVIVNETPDFDKDTKVLPDAFIPDDKKRTYDLCEKLYNNYFIRESDREVVTSKEDREVDDFINAIKDTDPMAVARKYIDPNLTDQEWFTSIKDKWFTMFRSNDRSGFEHVFVGEGKGKKLGGYHFWHKYFLDDGKGQVNGKDTIDYGGASYGSKALNEIGRKVADVVTLTYKWDAFETENNKSDDLNKRTGGFWVGCSPEGLIALGMARFTSRSTTAVINNAEYELKLFKDDAKKYINTFYPLFKKIVSPTVVVPDPPVTTADPPTEPDIVLNSDSVYQEIWTADQNENGVPAILPSDKTTPRDKGYVIVNETPDFDKDTKVLPDAFIPDDKKRTYDLCEKLYNNYFIRESDREVVTSKEDREVDDFINAIKDTDPMAVARKYIDPNLTDQEWFTSIKDKWFTMFRSNDRSGFEHVFVGEGKGKKLGGYHFWHKYFLDDGKGQVNGKDTIDYGGASYGSKALNEIGRKVADVVTLTYKWDAFETENNKSDDLNKRTGGFWVGCSPEGLIALGMARFKEASKGKTRAVINDAEYEFTLYTDIDRRIDANKNRTDDKYINTFWPKLSRIVQTPPPTPPPTPPTPPTPTPPQERGSVRIIAALVNPGPEVSDVGNETVTLINISNRAVDLKGWEIVDTNGNGFELIINKLDAGEVESITLSGAARTAQLGNKGGDIILKDGSGEVMDEVFYTGKQAKQGITILF